MKSIDVLTPTRTGRPWIWGLVRWLLKEWSDRRAIQRLESLNDYYLRDMGITRGTIQDSVRTGRRG